MQRLAVIIPAGGTLPAALASEAVADKSQLRVGDRTLLDTALDAVLGIEAVTEVVIGTARPEAVTRRDPRIRFGDPGDSAPQTIRNALQQLSPACDRVLIVTADLPFVNESAVRDFVANCQDADFCVGVIPKATFEREYPGSTNTYVPLRDGHFTAAGVFLVRRRAFLEALRRLDELFAQRKSVVGMAKLLGPMFLIRLILRQTDVAEVVARCEAILGCRGQAVLTAHPSLAFDIDAPDDLAYARAHRHDI
ncbi:MAG: NTP transferase domain-containing protein [Fimbriimonadaceae bacterium]|nr:NTP transferase domain-containing protein [Fimbriimonadaceae bacterium]